MATVLGIKNFALIRLGAQILETVDDVTQPALVLNVLYDDMKASLLALHPWRFSVLKTQLTVSTSPVGEYGYAFAMPGGALPNSGPLAVFDAARSVRPITDWDFQQNTVLTNITPIWIDHQALQSEATWAAPFANFFSVALAAAACKAITGDEKLGLLLYQEAYGSPSDNSQGGLLGVAKRAVARYRPSQSIFNAEGSNPLVDARFS